MKRIAAVSLAAFFVFLAVAVTRAQEPAPAPKPGPEHEKLAYFVGTWKSEGGTKASAFGPAGKFTFTETCDWLPGKFALLCRSDGNMMGGEYHALSVMSYDVEEKSYVYYETNNWGENIYSHGSVDGDTWTWANESKVNGKLVRGRFTLKRVSADTATYTFDMAMGSEPFANVMEGRQTRQK
ncbi:MAG TPA: DUF1579 family protein [Candidatus Sulfotelmatobacter sp.]|nr:DUF1579 family protein [Candidatus Sulfotelmatobacter sp.]